MSKTGWIILGICLFLVFCLCAGLLLAGRLATALYNGESKVDQGATKGYKDLKNPFSADGKYALSMDQLKELRVDWISGSVIVELTDGDTIQLQETADRSIREKDALRYGINGDTLRIQACQKNYVGKLPKKDLVLSLPRSMVAGLKECEFDLVSATLSAEDLTLEELEVNTVSGRIELNGMTVEEAEVDTVSGDVLLRDCAFGTLRMDSVSALTSLTGTVKKAKASSVSGSIQLYLDDCREVNISTMSGSVTLSFAKVPKELRVDTASGDADISLSKDASCTVKLDSMSGKLLLNMENVPSKQIVLGDGEAKFDIDSMSGEVWIHTK